MKTLVGILLTVGMAVGYTQAEARTCNSKHMAHKTKMKTEKLAVNKTKSSALERRCVCRSVTKAGMMSTKSFGGYKKAGSDIHDNGGSPLMPTITLPDSKDLRMQEDQLNRNLNLKEKSKDLLNDDRKSNGLDEPDK